MSLMERLHRAKAEMLDDQADPWKRVLERALPASVTCMSTVHILTLLNLPVTVDNARRLARSMTALGWVPLKSRKLAPGGWRGTECRGWARPLRETIQKNGARHGS
jgi:hypothetical protein